MSNENKNQQERGSSSGAVNCSACTGCQWQGGLGGKWCYMFDDAPENLPCAQHDKFEVERELAAIVLKKNPALLAMMVMAESDSPNI